MNGAELVLAGICEALACSNTRWLNCAKWLVLGWSAPLTGAPQVVNGARPLRSL